MRNFLLGAAAATVLRQQVAAAVGLVAKTAKAAVDAVHDAVS